MIEYIFMIIFSLIFANITQKRLIRGYKAKGYYFLSIIPLIIVSAYRVNIGSDYINYEYYFHRTWGNGNLEYCFIIFQQFVRSVFGEFRWMIILTTLLFILLSTINFYQKSCNYFYSVFIFIFSLYYFQSLCHIRFMIAFAIVLFSIRYVEEKNLLKFLICIVLAIGFHRSAVVAVILYWLYGRKLRIIEFPIIFIGGYIICKLLLKIVLLIGFSSYLTYLDGTNEILIGLLILNICIFLFYLIMGYFHKTLLNEEKFIFYFRIQYIIVVIALLSSYIPLAGRIATLFQGVQLFSLPYVLSKIKIKTNKSIICFTIALMYIIYCYYSIVIKGGFGVFPYQHI